MPVSSEIVRLRRSVLSVPAINQRALEKTHIVDCDAVIFDLEDSVAPEKKAEARCNLRRFFAESPLQGREVIIRINALDSEFGQDDLELVRDLLPDAVALPKVDDVASIAGLEERLTGTSPNLGIWAMMETARGVSNAVEIARMAQSAENRLDCFVIGLNDLRKDTGVPARAGRIYLVPWMMQVVLAARAYGLDVIDSVFNDFRDSSAFEAECEQGRDMGFDGKMLIHPAQIEAANQAFGPASEAVEEAQAIIAAFARPETQNLNVITMDGRMVERLHLVQAEKLVEQSRLIAERRTRA
ncbi:CoA ester lyase [Rhizobiales bacterium RZME27]|uniref:CoA ester lyase n=1 Tax=Endobacterium cereale TaxID=2663029 RepID=A0A6A8A7Y4_9HYPH|nr:CoA ester lyase [Endobacterium cereale]MEB2845196.1 CoA ester lyase [Endobacterium cereale]MQY45977.1 CoA ester lyase [Endobacterium cereale]